MRKFSLDVQSLCERQTQVSTTQVLYKIFKEHISTICVYLIKIKVYILVLFMSKTIFFWKFYDGFRGKKNNKTSNIVKLIITIFRKNIYGKFFKTQYFLSCVTRVRKMLLITVVIKQ